jgi:hypothetical protein
MFQKFVQRVNSQIPYNSNGKINAIPIIVYHDLTYSINDYNGMASIVTVPLFAQEMQYLHDNGFKVLVLNQLGYDTTNNIFYINNIPRSTTTATAAIIIVVLLGLGAIGNGSGSLLSIKYPDKNTKVLAGSLIAVSGTSAPSNATHTNCNVAVQINQQGFAQTSAQGPKGAGDYTKWTAITTSPTKQGLNQIEAQLLCFPSEKLTTPNLIKHLVHNVTGVQVVGMSTNVQSSPLSIPSTPAPPTPPPPSSKKAPTGQGPQSIIPIPR